MKNLNNKNPRSHVVWVPFLSWSSLRIPKINHVVGRRMLVATSLSACAALRSRIPGDWSGFAEDSFVQMTEIEGDEVAVLSPPGTGTNGPFRDRLHQLPKCTARLNVDKLK